jgi:hypothetical protein
MTTCPRPLKGFDADWSYVASLALDQTTGTGGVVYVAEYGAPSSIGVIEVKSAGEVHVDGIFPLAGL